MKKYLPALGLALACGVFPVHSRAEERVLYAFDDQSIPWQHNLKLTLVEAQKYPGNPVLRTGPAGAPDHGHAVMYGTVLKEGGKFRMWYLGMAQDTFDANTRQAPDYWRPMCYAESADGIAWVKPDLGLVKFNGNTHNNICLIQGDPFSLTKVDDFLAVLHEPNDPDPAKRYKAVYIAHMPYDEIHGGMSRIGKKEERVCSTICATSADGLSWKVVGDRPANAGGERYEVSSLYHFGNFYYTAGQLLSPWAWRADGSKIGRSTWVYRSPDFVTWSQQKAFGFARPGQLTNPPLQGEANHMGAGMWNRGNVVVGLYGMWQDGPGPAKLAKGVERLTGTHIDLGLIVSNDGYHFREPVPNFKVISRGRKGEWDHVALIQGNAFVNEGDKLMIWYSHWDTSGHLKNMEIGLATLRRDGFGYLSRMQDNNDAACTTATLEGGGRLLVNADGLSAAAPLTVELVDAWDRPLAGYSGADAVRLSASGTRQEIVWPRSGSSRLPAGKFAVRIGFPDNSQARLYSLNVLD